MRASISLQTTESKGKPVGFLSTFFLLRLLYIYQGIISSRPIEMGNREFLECMLDASRDIASNLKSSGEKNPGILLKLASLYKLIDTQAIANSKEASLKILALVSVLLNENFKKRPGNKIYLETSLPAITQKYKNIHVIFGPGLGLGDQVTFFSFLKNISLHYPGSQICIYTLYPGLWRTLLPAAREVQYRLKPLRPFYKLANPDPLAGPHRELVIMADFDNFNFHQDLGSTAGRDILEIALGKACAWYNQYDCPWIKFEPLSSPQAIGKNYWILSKLANRLFPAIKDYSAWEPFVRKPVFKRDHGKTTIFLNPFTSKKYELRAEDWYDLLCLINERLKDETDWNVIIFPGLSLQSREFASQLACLCQNGLPRIPARMLQSRERKFPTVYNTFNYLPKELQGAGICITVDTFTGHLMPLYGITTLVITDRDNKAFWVPGQWSYYCLLDRMKIALPALLANLLTAEKQASLFNADTKAIINELVVITETATQQGIDHAGIVKMQGLLFNLLKKLPDIFPYKAEGKRWLLSWGQLGGAMQKDPVPPRTTIVYVQSWQQSEFFKFITITKDY